MFDQQSRTVLDRLARQVQEVALAAAAVEVEVVVVVVPEAGPELSGKPVRSSAVGLRRFRWVDVGRVETLTGPVAIEDKLAALIDRMQVD